MPNAVLQRVIWRLSFLNGLDFVTTCIGISLGARELNPLTNAFTIQGLLLVKVMATPLLIGLVYWGYKVNQKFGMVIGEICAVVFAGLVASNCIVILNEVGF